MRGVSLTRVCPGRLQDKKQLQNREMESSFPQPHWWVPWRGAWRLTEVNKATSRPLLKWNSKAELGYWWVALPRAEQTCRASSYHHRLRAGIATAWIKTHLFWQIKTFWWESATSWSPWCSAKRRWKDLGVHRHLVLEPHCFAGENMTKCCCQSVPAYARGWKKLHLFYFAILPLSCSILWN